MATVQTVMWTALPNGVQSPRDTSQYLKLSAFMSPRLDSNVTPLWLGAFPDFADPSDPLVNWASVVAAMRFKVEFRKKTGGLITVPATVVRRIQQCDPALWAQAFSAGTPVKSYSQPAVGATKVKTFGVRESATAIRDHFSAIAGRAAAVYKIPLPEEILAPPGFENSPLTQHLAQQLAQVGIARSPSKAGVQAAAPPPSGPTIHETFTAFHAPYTTLPEAQRLAREAAEREPDFHKATTALGNFPALLPLLGMVVNLEIPLSAALLAEMGAVKAVRVVTEWPTSAPAGVTRKDVYPWTACAVTGKATALGYKLTSFQAASKEGELKDGYLIVRDTSADGANDPVVLTNIDVDNALSKVFGTFESMVQQIASRVMPPIEVFAPEAGSAEAAAVGGASVAALDAPAVAGATASPLMKEELLGGLPTMGQPTIALSVNGAAMRLETQLRASASKNALIAGNLHLFPKDYKIENYAEELTRGYRVDVWDSVTKVWHPLCQRLGTYVLGDTTLTWNGGETTLVDEGWVQLAPTSETTQSQTAPPELRLHEHLFTWNGWSLVVQRPGAALTEADDSSINTMRRDYLDPDTGEVRPLGEYDNESLPLTTRFKVPPGTLPRLRLGTTYRFRARVVDLAGNSVPYAPGSPTNTPGGATDTLTTVTRAIVHKRYEPVKPPTVVIPNVLTRGETPLGLVVRSNYDTTPVQSTSRHICPPRTSFTMSEAHAAFDLDTEGRPMDGSLQMYENIRDRDAWDFPYELVPRKDHPELPPIHGSQLPMETIPAPLPYLPDVPSRGASFTGLPGQKAASGKVSYAGRLPLAGSTTVRLADDSTATSEALRIPFTQEDSAKAERVPFKLIVKGIEGTDPRLPSHASPAAPKWSESNRTLTVQLPKGDQVAVELSSFVNADDMNVFGQYQWGIIKSVAETQPAMLSALVSPEALSPSVMTATSLSLPLLARSDLALNTNALIDVSVLGNNWTVTPHDDLTLVHAVRQPMIAPNSTAYLTAVRAPGGTTAVIRDWVQIHGKSTARLVMDAYWKEPVDKGPGTSTPLWGTTALEQRGQAFETLIDAGDTVALSLAVTPPDALTMPVTPVTKNRDSRKQRHSFGDTKHRKVKYTMTAASRFQHYFSPEEGPTTRTGNSRWIHVRSTARPLAPKVDLVIPAFKWTRSGTTNASSTRGGGRLRVYLERPWFTSGEGEKLAVLLWHAGNSMSAFDTLRPYVTEWGNDPVYRSAGSVPVSIPTPDNFQDYVAKKTYLHTAELGESNPLHVTAMLYDVQYDAESDRWFADIKMNQGNAYLPFIKLALARYQQYSLTGLELSPTVAVDAVQLTPDRSAAVKWISLNTEFEVTVNGRSYVQAKSGYGPLMTLSVETRAADGFAWVPIAAATELPMVTYTPAMKVYGDTRTYWRRTVGEKGLGLGAENRIVIREYERHITGSTVPSESVGSRPVYVDVLPLVKPQV